MEKVIRDVDAKNGVLQITFLGNRWYSQEKKSKKTGIPEREFYPAVTWIADYYPKGIAFYKWLSDKGWNKAEEIKTAAGEVGSRTHKACEMLLRGERVELDTNFYSEEDEEEHPLDEEEWDNVYWFNEWWKEYEAEHKIEILAVEKTIIHEPDETYEFGFGGTLDILMKVDDEVHLIDLKTGANIWPGHKLQVSAYRHEPVEVGDEKHKIDKAFILQVGYHRNKNKKWKLTEIEDQIELFQHAYGIWMNENKNTAPKSYEYPIEFELDLTKVKNHLKVNKK